MTQEAEESIGRVLQITMSKIDASGEIGPYAHRGEANSLRAEPRAEHTVNTRGRVNDHPRLAAVRGLVRQTLLLNGNALGGEYPVMPTRTD